MQGVREKMLEAMKTLVAADLLHLEEEEKAIKTETAKSIDRLPTTAEAEAEVEARTGNDRLITEVRQAERLYWKEYHWRW